MSLHCTQVTIDLSDVVKDLDDYDGWELLQQLWDKMKYSGNKEYWESFYEDNRIKEV